MDPEVKPPAPWLGCASGRPREFYQAHHKAETKESTALRSKMDTAKATGQVFDSGVTVRTGVLIIDYNEQRGSKMVHKTCRT